MISVQQLQSESTDPQVAVVTLLQHALVVASSRGDEEFANWVRRELNGYESGDSQPEYRRIGGPPCDRSLALNTEPDIEIYVEMTGGARLRTVRRWP